MPEDWTIEFEGFEFAPIPESWLDHPHAEDRDHHDGPRLFAVSAATYGSRTLKVRYAESRTGEVLVLQLPAQRHNGGVVPQGLLTGEGWTRSLYPPPRIDPMDLLRPVEEEHLQGLWAGRGLLPGETQRRAVADGGDGRCRRRCSGLAGVFCCSLSVAWSAIGGATPTAGPTPDRRATRRSSTVAGSEGVVTVASETDDGEVSQEEDIGYEAAAENPGDVPPGTYSEEIGDDDGYRVMVVPEKRTRVDDPRETPGQRRIGDGWESDER